MRNLLLICVLVLSTACSGVVDRPENLLSKTQMAEVLAELAINDQVFLINSTANIELGTRFILNQKKIKAKDFIDSYQYYALNNKMQGILEDAQKIVMEKDPKAEEYIKKKLKETDKVPPFAR